MPQTSFAPALAVTERRSRRRRRTPAPGPAPFAVDVLAGLTGLGLGITVALGVSAESWSDLRAPGGWLTASGRLSGLVGTYAMLIVVLLAGRVPVVERTLGQDRLTRWHRKLAPWSLVLIAAHGVLITAGYAQSARTGMLHQFGLLLTTYPGILAATVAFLLLMAAGLTSARIARRRMRYETWWAVHLYTYLALALSFSHQLATGASFVGHPVTRIVWTVLWLGTAGTVLVYRVVLPLWRSAFHSLRVVEVRPEAPGVVSVLLKGRRLHRLPLSGGQFFQWRFLKRGMWWQAHPYSVSAVPDPPYLRFTVKNLGDHSGALASIEPGTRVAIEGPYGAFTADARDTDQVALIGAGVGITPLRALLEDLPADVDATMIVRAHAAEDVIHRDELDALMTQRGGELHEVLGSRGQVPFIELTLDRLIPDLHQRDVFICGPTGFTASVREAARHLGVSDERIHHETFAF
ncbi:MAG: ferredoxin reductase family protein [Solirubrobacteraceae bacterium]